MTDTVLAIDDEPANLLLIEAYLDGEGHNVQYFTGAAPAIDYLEGGGRADAVLLDRMMPVTDGLTFMARFRAMPGFVSVPVILQTAAAFPAQIAEGIAAGAYYYLTKPYPPEVLKAVLSRALADYAALREREPALADLRAVADRIRSIELSFQTLDDVRGIAAFVASLYPDPAGTILGIRELMLNAVEHGNLGITYKEKSALLQDAAWEQEVERRLALPEHKAKQAHVRVERDATATTLTIEDAGAGFEPLRYLTFEPSRLRDSHGRGIAMARMVSFDEIAYVAPGNKVVCLKRT